MTLLDVLVRYGTCTSSAGTCTITEGGIVIDNVNLYVDTIDVTISLGQCSVTIPVVVKCYARTVYVPLSSIVRWI